MSDTQDKAKLPDYFKLPFEVHYSDAVPITQYEFKSDPDENAGRFSDVKAVHMEQGSSYGLVLACSQNNGPELYCCITNSHDEVSPDWLRIVSEDGMDFNYATNYFVQVEGDEIKFFKKYFGDDTMDFGYMESCCSEACMVYHITDARPDFFILDSENSRLKVNPDGYILDEHNVETNERIFDLDNIEHEKYEDYTSLELWEAKFNWVKSILEMDFPQDKHLKLSFDTE